MPYAAPSPRRFRVLTASTRALALVLLTRCAAGDGGCACLAHGVRCGARTALPRFSICCRARDVTPSAPSAHFARGPVLSARRRQLRLARERAGRGQAVNVVFNSVGALFGRSGSCFPVGEPARRLQQRWAFLALGIRVPRGAVQSAPGWAARVDKRRRCLREPTISRFAGLDWSYFAACRDRFAACTAGVCGTVPRSAIAVFYYMYKLASSRYDTNAGDDVSFATTVGSSATALPWTGVRAAVARYRRDSENASGAQTSSCLVLAVVLPVQRGTDQFQNYACRGGPVRCSGAALDRLLAVARGRERTRKALRVGEAGLYCLFAAGIVPWSTRLTIDCAVEGQPALSLVRLTTLDLGPFARPGAGAALLCVLSRRCSRLGVPRLRICVRALWGVRLIYGVWFRRYPSFGPHPGQRETLSVTPLEQPKKPLVAYQMNGG